MMQPRVALYPGSFDPVTLGHMEMISRGARLFDTLVVGVAQNIQKKGAIPPETRVRLLEACCRSIPNVRVALIEGLTADYCREHGIGIMLRGMRSSQDFEGERNLAQVNQVLAPDIETVFLMTTPGLTLVSSTVVRELAMYGRSLEGFVPEEVREEIERTLADAAGGGNDHGGRQNH